MTRYPERLLCFYLELRKQQSGSKNDLLVEVSRPGTFDTSVAQLHELTGIDRRPIGKFLEEAEEAGQIEKTFFLLEAIVLVW